MTAKLTELEVTHALGTHPGWSRRGDLIQRIFLFKDFVAAMAFVNAIAAEAERTQHHPDIAILYSKVTLGFSTHDAGGLTVKDFAGAAFADAVARA